MVLFELTLLTIIISLVLFIIGILFKKKALILSYFGALMLLIIGIGMFNNPIEFQSGTNTTIDNNNNTIETFTYSTQNPTQNTLLSWTLTLLGLAGILISSLIIREERHKDIDEGFK